MLHALLLLSLTCGTERSAVKTLSDPDAATVDIAHPKESTVARLRDLQPSPYRGDDKRSGLEHAVFFVEAYLLGYKKEKNDGDLHLVIADEPNGESGTMIVELPAPECLDDSKAREALTTARTAFERLVQDHPPSEKYRVLRRPMKLALTGVAFFDRVHGQKGVAPNGVELHPVLAIGKAK